MNTPSDEILLIGPVAGFDPAIGHLVSMLEYARWSLLKEVEGLNQEGLDHLLDDQANSVGMLLEHIASVEEWYQEDTFGVPNDFTDPRRRTVGGNLGNLARSTIKGHPLHYYLERLGGVRERTLEQLAARNDAWLYAMGALGKRKATNYFKWFHVVEEELGHTAQIRMVRKRLP